MSNEINREVLLKTIDEKNVPEDILEFCRKIDTDNQQDWIKLYLAAKILEKNNTNSNYDNLIIEYLEESHRKGLNTKSNKEYYLDSLKILAGLYLKYTNYKKANNCLLLLEGIIPEKSEWLIKLKSTIHIYHYIDLYMDDPKIFIDKILGYDGTRELKSYESSIIKTFIYRCIDKIDQNYGEIPSKRVTFYFNLINTIEPNDDFFKDELDVLIKKLYACLDQAFIDVTSNEPRALALIIKKIYKEINEIREMIENEINEVKLRLVKIDNQVEKKIIDAIRSQEPELADKKNIGAEHIKILIIGDLSIPENEIFGISKSMYNIPKKNIELLKDWEKIKNFNIEKLRYCSNYDGIMIGPVPHCVKGKGDYSSIFELIKNEEGYPLHVEVREPDGKPKITKTTFRDALRKLVEGILAKQLN